MLYTHNLEDEKFQDIILFIKLYLEGEDKYKSYIDNVINDVHCFSLNIKNIYTIDKDNHSIITYLKESDQNYFKNIVTENLNTSDYEKILGFIENYPESIC